MKFIKIAFLIILLGSFDCKADELVKFDAYSRYDKAGILETLIEADIKDGWHIFAPYEQEFGSPLNINWINVDKADILEESFSKTEKFNQEDFSFDGYEKKAYYKATIKTSKPQNSKVFIEWLACADECIPGKTEIIIVPQDSILFDKKINKIKDSFLSNDYKEKVSVWYILLLALTGGIILNLMPCVFPVLGIKILSLVQTDTKQRYTEAVFYTLGVVFSMVLLAGVLFVLRQFNTHIGWGFQLQSTWFVAFLLLVFIVLTLITLDVITISGRYLGKLAFLNFSNCKLNAFMTGLLAVVVATPCTAPFMGVAVAYALTASSYAYFMVFIALGLGYSLPFVLISWNPSKLKMIMPKPGKWMVVLKKIFAIPLIFTCVWLFWVLLSQLGIVTSGKNLEWNAYSEQKVIQALEEKRPVFIDFTAKWCLTCLVNKQAALQSDKLAELVKEKNILLLRADATKQDYNVMRALEYYGRASVPLYVYYDGKSDDYLILPQILTSSILKEYLQ
ncbi:MAG: hypothetical protein E7017_01130 [Alphaproteobacteria bacterium]|nr:hypothetical protein [Alphaproteobacteria bacterium]